MTAGTQHVDFAALVDYWFDAREESPVEEHLLACDECSGRLAWIAGLADALPEVVRRGEALMVLTPGVLQRLAAGGMRLREYRVGPGGSVNCTIAPEDDLVVAHLQAPLAGVSRIDVLAIAGGVEHRLEDVPFDPAGGEVLVAPQTPRLRALGVVTEVARLVAVGSQGETLIGEYTFKHSPHRPG